MKNTCIVPDSVIVIFEEKQQYQYSVGGEVDKHTNRFAVFFLA